MLANAGLGLSFTGLVILKTTRDRQRTGYCRGGRFYIVEVSDGQIQGRFIYEGSSILTPVSAIAAGTAYQIGYADGDTEGLKRNIDLIAAPLLPIHKQINLTNSPTLSDLLNNSEIIEDVPPPIEPQPDTQPPIAVPSLIQPGD